MELLIGWVLVGIASTWATRKVTLRLDTIDRIDAKHRLDTEGLVGLYIMAAMVGPLPS